MIFVFPIAAFAVCILWNWTLYRTNEKLWNMVHTLEADKAALMESLARAQGKPFIQPGHQERIPSEGWFDSAPTIKVKPD